MKIIADLHTHATHRLGKYAVLDQVTAAMARGLQAIAVTQKAPGAMHWLGDAVADFGTLRREVDEVARRSEGLRVLAGIDCQIVSPQGDLNVAPSTCRDADLVLAGFHSVALHWVTGLPQVWGRRNRVRSSRAAVQAVLTHEIDVITGTGAFAATEMIELARACVLRETAFELGGRHSTANVDLYRLAAREGVKFLITADAYSPVEVGNFTRGLAVARAAGVKPSQILNGDAGALFAWLERKRAGRRAVSVWRDWTEQPGNEDEDRIEDVPRQRPEDNGWKDWSSQGKIH